MKATNMMREMMVAASLLAVSACGAVTPGNDDSGVGSNGSADEPMVGSECEAASDCGGGLACDTSTHECVAEVLALEETNFVNDGLRWWSSTSGPKLWGTYQGGADTVVQVKVGAGAAMLASVDGSRWNVQFPTGTIMTADTLVSVTMTDPARGGVVSLEQTFALDSAGPVIGVGPSKVRDERGDVIDFSSGAPVHDHQGTEIDLAAGGCPVVGKYSYLMDTNPPAYGSEITPNRITWAVTLQDAKLTSAEFLIRDAGGDVVRDWKPLVGSGTSYPVTLYRDGDAGMGALAMTAGKYTVEVRATDWAGLKTSASYCVDFQPLAAPLQIAQAVIPTDADALKGWTLTANSPISRITNGTGAAIVEQTITQYSSEPVVMTLGSSTLAGTYRMQYAQGWVVSSRTKTTISCTNYDCNMPTATIASPSGALTTNHTKTVQLVNSAGAVVTPTASGGYVIPGRAAGAPPAEYRVRVRISNAADYGATPLWVYGERTVETLNYTGSPSTNTTSACTSVGLSPTGVRSCLSVGTYQYIRGINTIGLSLSPVSIHLKTAPSAATTPAMPVHVSPALFVSPALSWDGGDENTF